MEGPFWRVELSTEQRTFVAVVVIIAVVVAVGTLIFACVWCLLDQDGLCPPGWCRCLGTPKDTFSPQRWWMEALAQRVENLEAGQPLMERTGRRKRVRVVQPTYTTLYFYIALRHILKHIHSSRGTATAIYLNNNVCEV